MQQFGRVQNNVWPFGNLTQTLKEPMLQLKIQTYVHFYSSL